MPYRDRSVLLYDGDCGFCQSSVCWLQRRVPFDGDAVAWQDADLDVLGTTRERAEREVIWVDSDGYVVGGAQAVAHLLSSADAGWRMLGALLRMPLFRLLADGVYRVIANNRQRLPSGTPACALPAGRRPTHYRNR